MNDHHFLQRAIELADRPTRSTSPNPRVGAVVVRDGRIVGEGHHAGAGHEHAEEVALRQAGARARGATLYCTLEPCSHSGAGKCRPPCAPMVVSAGIARAVIAQLDPNPRVSGRGVQMLRDAGVDVSVCTPDDRADADRPAFGVAHGDSPSRDLPPDGGALWRAAVELNEGFNTAMTEGRPFIHLKVAQSLDGRIAAADGTSQWITGPDARVAAHHLRGDVDAVAVGVGTVLADDPLLTVRHGRRASPPAVVFDRQARTPLSARLLVERPDETIVVTGDDAPVDRVMALRDAGVTVISVATLAVPEAARVAAGAQPGGGDRVRRLSLPAALDELRTRGILSLLVEGGPTLTSSFLAAGLWDRLSAFVAPLLVGGSYGGLIVPPAATIGEAVRLTSVSTGAFGSDLFLTGYRAGWHRAIATVGPQEADDVYRAG